MADERMSGDAAIGYGRRIMQALDILERGGPEVPDAAAMAMACLTVAAIVWMRREGLMQSPAVADRLARAAGAALEIEADRLKRGTWAP